MNKNRVNLISVQFLRKSYLLIILVIFNLLLPVESKVYFLEADFYQDKTQSKKIVLGKGEVIVSDNPISRIAISEPNIVDVQILNEKEMFSRAKQLGSSTILIWEKGKSKPSRFDVEVWPDINYLTKQLQELDKNIIVEYIPPNSSLSSASGSQGVLGALDPSANAGGQTATIGSQPPSGGQSSSSSSRTTLGKIILKGEVANAEVIARALQLAGVYVGDQGIKIISQPGGQIVDGLAGRYDLSANSDSQSSQSTNGSGLSFGNRDPIRFTSNRYANLSRGVISTTQNGAVLSFLTVKDPAQIAVAIRFYEIQRNLAKDLGLNAIIGGSTLQGGSFVGGNAVSQAIGGIGSIANLMSFMASTGQAPAEFEFNHGSIAGGSHLAQALGQGVTGVIFNPDNGIGAIIQALQERGEIKTLAEPTLVIANGEPATFLAGGEVPIQRTVITTGGAGQDVAYEPFGIRFSLLPTLTSNNKIYLQLAPEIRDIDTALSNLVAPTGSTAVRPPAFRTRRTQTQIELESGQAFAISGLLREDNIRSLRKVPGIGDIPVLGSLFRSKSFRKGETELLIVVSPQIVKPTSVNKIAKFSIPDTPSNYFKQIPSTQQHKDKLDSEEGYVEIKGPINPSKYNEPANINNNDKLNNLSPPNKDLAVNEEVKPVELEQYTNNRLNNDQGKKEIEKVKKSRWVELKAKFVKGFLSNNKKAEKLTDKETKKKLVMEIKQAKRVTKEAELYTYQQSLKETWQQELQKYAQAKEAMKLAREQISN